MSHRLELGIIALLLLLSLGGCKKKYNCSYNYFYMGQGVAFGGFEASELKTVVLQQYEPGSNFKKLKSSDTIDASGAVFQNDTAYLSINNNTWYETFFYLGSDSVEYMVVMPEANRRYFITLTRSKMTESWWQDHECSMGSGQSRNTSFYTTVNSQPCKYYTPYPNNFLICLRR